MRVFAFVAQERSGLTQILLRAHIVRFALRDATPRIVLGCDRAPRPFRARAVPRGLPAGRPLAPRASRSAKRVRLGDASLGGGIEREAHERRPERGARGGAPARGEPARAEPRREPEGGVRRNRGGALQRTRLVAIRPGHERRPRDHEGQPARAERALHPCARVEVRVARALAHAGGGEVHEPWTRAARHRRVEQEPREPEESTEA